MGDSSECFSANSSHLSLPTDIKFMDNVSDSDEDETVKKTFSSGNKNYINGDLNATPRDVRIQIEDLNTPVPVCPDTDASCSDTNGLEENCVTEPKISSSEALGRETNGFDEAAEVEGSEEEVRTGSPTGSSDAWAENNFSDEDSNYGLDRDTAGVRRTEMMFSHDSMTSTFGVRCQQSSCDTYSGKSHLFERNGSSSPHKTLYSGREMKEFVGKGENTSLYNYPPVDREKPLRTTDTYEASALSCGPLSCKSEIDEPVSFNLHSSSGPSYSSRYRDRQFVSTRTDTMDSSRPFSSPKLTSNPRTPLPSSCSPSISGSSVRIALPYETPTSPPLGNPVDESKVRQSAIDLLSEKGISSQALRGMPRGEMIPYDENELDATSEVEAAKKKKKKKKRSGNKSGDVIEPEKKQGKSLPPCGMSTLDKAVTGTVQESRAQQYPPPSDGGSSVMENSHRSKAKQSGKNKKKTEVKSYSAKEIDGNRGCESIDSLLNFVEGKKPPSKAKAATASSESKKKQKKQKVVTRTIANSASFEQGKSTPLVMGSVVEEAVIVTTEEAKLCIDSSTISTSDSGLLSIDDSLVSPKVDGSGDQSVILEDTSENTPNPTASNCANDKVKQTDASSPSDPVTEPETMKVENGVKIKAPKSYLTAPSPPTVADLEFTNFEGLVDHYTEQPFEKYVGRKKKQRQQPTQQFRQGYATNSSFGNTRGRWPAANQPNNVHVNNTNRVHGNGLSHSSQTSHSQAGATNKLPANQSVGRYPVASTPQSFAAKASSSSRTSQQLATDQRKSTGSAASSTTSPPPPREEFPPLRPSADVQTLKKEISPSTSTTTSTSSPAAPSKNSSSVSSSGIPAVATGGPPPSAESRTADRRDVRAPVAAPSGNCRSFDRFDILKIQQFLEMLYPKQNETCYFYSENAKRYHFLKMSAKDH